NEVGEIAVVEDTKAAANYSFTGTEETAGVRAEGEPEARRDIVLIVLNPNDGGNRLIRIVQVDTRKGERVLWVPRVVVSHPKVDRELRGQLHVVLSEEARPPHVGIGTQRTASLCDSAGRAELIIKEITESRVAGASLGEG